MKMNKLDEKKGITLISLIIAVVILLLLLKLVDLAIPNGAFDKAESTQDTISHKEDSEQNRIDNIISWEDVPDGQISNIPPNRKHR